MSNKQQLLDWAASGHLDAAQLEQALIITDSLPSAANNLRFLSRVLLAFAVVLLCSGVIFFFAYNWDELSRHSKFAIAQAALLLSLLPLLRFNLQQPAAQAAICAASLLVGALLALVGQTYQSGADTYQLFLIWAVLITPWAVLARMPVLWLLLLVLLNLSLVIALENLAIYHLLAPLTHPGWLLFALNACAAGLWHQATHKSSESRLLRWAARAINLYSLLIISVMALGYITSWSVSDALTLPIWACCAALWLYLYRVRRLDLVMLSALLMAAIVLSVTTLAHTLSDILPFDILFLLLALTVMGLSSAAALWLKQLHRQANALGPTSDNGVAHD
ncbi:MAG: DUF2157 domain-containing protein [Pseudomonas sp.]|nr:DUF2157 domain-containing protein [Pseudomonas sp.]